MARIRSIKPDFWSHEQVLACSRDARLLFIGLWNFCDDRGRYVNSPKTAKAQVFPGDDDATIPKVRRWLDELATNDLVRFYEVDGKSFLHIPGWHHQKIDKPQKPKYPAPPGSLGDNSPNDRGSVATDRIGEDRTGSERIGEGAETRAREGWEVIAEGWRPSAATTDKAKALGLTDADIAKAVTKFIANHRSKATKRADWDAAFEVWCIDDAAKLGRKPPSPDAPAAKGRFWNGEDTPQFAAWEKHFGKRLPRDSNFGWHFDSEWPPGHEKTQEQTA